MMVGGLVCGHRAGADDGGGGEPGDGLGGQRPGADREGPAGARPAGGSGAGGGARAEACPGARGDMRAARRGGRAELCEQQRLDQQQGADREDRRERVVVLLQLALEGATAVAVAHVAAGGRARADQPLGGFAELQAHLLAAELARLGGLRQRDAGAHQQRLDGGHGRLHRVRDVFVGERVDLAQQQGGALRLRELLHVGEQLAEALAAKHAVAGREAVVGVVDVHRVHADGAGASQVVERAVARDAVQPRAHVDVALVGEDRVEGGREDLLQDVLGVLARAEHVAHEGQQARLVAGAERLEGSMLAASGQRDEPLVRLQAKQRRWSPQAGRGARMC